MNSTKLISCGFVLLLTVADVGYAVENHRLARYTLQSAAPSRAQADLLSTTVKTKFPGQIATVGEAIEYILQRSGYKLQVTEEFRSTLGLPLPYVHRELGPLNLRLALKTLTGGVWELQENSRERVIWFQQSSSSYESLDSTHSLDRSRSIQENSNKKIDSQPAKAAELERVWTLKPFRTLRSNLMRWAEEVNWTVEWNSRHDYEIYHASSYEGTFFEAVRTLLEHYAEAPVPLIASFYAGNSVLVIEPYHARSSMP